MGESRARSSEGTHSDHHIDARDPIPPRRPTKLLAEVALAVPHLMVLFIRLVRDPRVPRRRKLVAGVAGAYLLAPVDVIPDFIPVVGHIDDIVFAAFAIRLLLDSVPASVQEEYWEGSADVLDLVRALTAWGAEMVPKPLRRLIGGAT